MKKLMILLALLLLPAFVCCSAEEASVRSEYGMFYDLETGELKKRKTTYDTYRYVVLEDGTAMLDGIYPYDEVEVFQLPSELDGYPVTAIRSDIVDVYALQKMKKLLIPASINRIVMDDEGDMPFIQLPPELEELVYVGGESVFETEDGLVYQGDALVGALAGLIDTQATVRAGTASVALDVFGECKQLETIVLPASMTKIETKAWWDSEQFTALASFVVEEGNPHFSSCDGILYEGDVLWACPPKLQAQEVVVREGTKQISTAAFFNCQGIDRVVLPESMEKLQCQAFYGCNALREINLPASINTIEEGAFAYCGNITAMTLDEDNTVYSLVDGFLVDNEKQTIILALPRDNTDIALPEEIRAIGGWAFTGLRFIERIRLHEGLERIGDEAFCNVYLSSVEFPATLRELGCASFAGCYDLKKVSFAGQNTALKEIPEKCFGNCDFTALELPEGIETIGAEAFRFCSYLNSIRLPEGVETVGKGAFQYCKALAEVELPSTLKCVEAEAFGQCAALDKLVLPQGLEEFDLTAIRDCKKLEQLIIPPETSVIDSIKEDSAGYYVGDFEGWIAIAKDGPAWDDLMYINRLKECLYHELPFLRGPLHATACDDGQISAWLEAGAEITFSFSEYDTSYSGSRCGPMKVSIQAPDGSSTQESFYCRIKEGQLYLGDNWMDLSVEADGVVKLTTKKWTLELKGED